MTTRRAFIREVGVSLAALVASGCASLKPTPTCYAPPPPPVTPTAESGPWGELRSCWLGLGDPRFRSTQTGGGDTYAQAEEFGKTLRQRHQAALDALVADGSLSADVSAEMAVAYEEALGHLQRKLATCYAPLMEGEANPYPPREGLNVQAAALTEMAQRSDIDPATVAKAQATLERDIAWLAEYRATRQPGDIEAITASPAEVEAARILVELLLGRK